MLGVPMENIGEPIKIVGAPIKNIGEPIKFIGVDAKNIDFIYRIDRRIF
jgi:hypothetical protein